jgi:hypothetical protein
MIIIPIRNSIVAIIPACHAGDPSSILGCGGFLFLKKTKKINNKYLQEIKDYKFLKF